jgi:hypothetical protein
MLRVFIITSTTQPTCSLSASRGFRCHKWVSGYKESERLGGRYKDFVSRERGIICYGNSYSKVHRANSQNWVR